MRKMTGKVLAVILAIVMVLSIPAFAFAEDELSAYEEVESVLEGETLANPKYRADYVVSPRWDDRGEIIHLSGRWDNGSRIVFIMHINFSTTTMEQFNTALFRWNQGMAINNMFRRDPTVRHDGYHIWDFHIRDQQNRVYRRALGVNRPIATARMFHIGTNSQGHLPNLPRIVEADIVVNVSHPFGNNLPGHDTRFDIWTVLAHEAGHAIGLEHAYSGFAGRVNIMHPHHGPGDLIRTLGPGDRNGINLLNYR